MRVSENVRTTANKDGAVLMDIKGGHMVTLNPIGSIIWQQLSDGRSPEQITDHLASEFAIPRERQAPESISAPSQQVFSAICSGGAILTPRTSAAQSKRCEGRSDRRQMAVQG